MVANTGKALRTDTIKPLNLPEEIMVEEDAAGCPVVLKNRRRQKIIRIDDHWRLDDEWWRRDAVTRLYYAVIPASGQKIILYKDGENGKWYRQDL